MKGIGIVAIGRNEGERLARCLDSVVPLEVPIVYVDSGSTDGSVALARGRGASVVDLDRSVPFTAARARNTGFERLLALHPELELVQFVDGDCEVARGWIARAVRELEAEPSRGAVCGRRRERFRGRSVYDVLCDIEWDTPVGEAKACGGDAMMRVRAFRQAGGYDPSIVAGEDEEICVRLRRSGWTITRLDAEMTLHDAAITRFGQWWRRMVRSGHAYAEGLARHGRAPEKLWRRQNAAILAWGLLLPALVLATAVPTRGASLALLGAYPAQVVRCGLANRRRGLASREAFLYGAFCTLGKFAQAVGQLTYLARRLGRTPARLIEYKGAGASPPRPARRVAYLVNQYPRTSHSFIRREIQAVEALGIEVLRFSLRPLDGPLPTEADRREAELTRMVLPEGVVRHALAVARAALRGPAGMGRAFALAVRLGWRSERGLLRHLAYLAEACVLVAWLRGRGVEHLHAHFGTNPAAVAALCRALGGPPYSFTVHGPDEFDKPEFLGLREKIRRAAFVVGVSSFARAQLCRWARYDDWPKIQVVRCGLDAELLRAPPSAVPETRRLVCVARLSAQKGHLLLVEAAARLAAEVPPFEVALVGDGPLRGALEARIRSEGVQDRVHVLGWMSGAEVRDQIVRSRALVLPSFAEGLPVVVMEALALGRPVITTAIAGTPELVSPGVTGWLVPAGSVEALADAMRAALEASPARLGQMGRAGADLVARHHDAGKEARKLARLFGAAPPDEDQPAARVAGLSGAS